MPDHVKPLLTQDRIVAQKRFVGLCISDLDNELLDLGKGRAQGLASTIPERCPQDRQGFAEQIGLDADGLVLHNGEILHGKARDLGHTLQFIGAEIRGVRDEMSKSH